MGDEIAPDDLVPVKEGFGSNSSRNLLQSVNSNTMDDGSVTNRLLQQRRAVCRIEREELEDKFLRMHEENILLKKHARKQEDKIKRMATKLLRLISDKKKFEQEGGVVVKKRDIESEEMIEDMQNKITDVEKQNSQLKDKLLLLKQQLALQLQRPTPYNYVQPRINTGIPKHPIQSRLLKGMRVTGVRDVPSNSRHDSHPGMQYDAAVLEEVRAENKSLEEVVESLQEQVQLYEQDIDALKEELKENERHHEEELLKIKSRLTAGQRLSLQENVDLIRLQREVKEKATKLIALQGQYENIEENLKSLKTSHDQILSQLDTLNNQLKEEQNRCLNLQNELKDGTTTQRMLVELQEQISDLQKENQLLKEANEKLLNSAFDMDRERHHSSNENIFKIKISQLEATIKADLHEKKSLHNKLSQEKDEFEKLQQELRDSQIAYFSLREQLDELNMKMNSQNKDNLAGFAEVEAASILLKQRNDVPPVSDLSFLGKIEDESKDIQQQLVQLQAEHADTILELEKTRNMLIMQHKINKDYQTEVETVTQKMADYNTEYETKMQEYVQLADIRASRIKKLEKQLRDIAYGTKQYKIREDSGEEIEIDKSIQLERGQNLFEIHISKILISPEGLRAIEDEEPTTFATWEFYDFEIQATPVIKGSRPEFDFTSQYVVKVDDFFLHYIQKESTLCEFHQAFGTDYVTLAACQLKFKDIFDKPHGRIHCKTPLLGAKNGISGLCYGTIEYWIRLCVPMEQALRLFKERTKALGYVSANNELTDRVLHALDDNAYKIPDDSVNELHVKILRCTGLKARRKDVQPSPYVIYSFYDFEDHDTCIIPNSNNPEFNDHRSYPVAMDIDLDFYLKSNVLQIYVFDDVDPKETFYLGVANVPLIPLSRDKEIKGTFELKQSDGSINGSLDVALYWQYSYLPPSGFSKTSKTIPPEPSRVKNKKIIESVKQGNNLLSEITKSFKSEVSFDKLETNIRSPIKTSLSDSSLLESPVIKKPPIPSSRTRRTLANKANNLQHKVLDDSLEIKQVKSDSPPVPAPRTASIIKYTETKKDIIEDSEKSVHELMEEDSLEQLAESKVKKLVASLESATEKTEEVLSPVSEDIGFLKDTFGEVILESDTDEVVMFPISQLPTNNRSSDTVIVFVSHLRLLETSKVMNDPNVQMLFVEYQFLGCPPEELEVPFSLPKPKPNGQSIFNFRKMFHIDAKNNYERRQCLASMILPDSPDQGKIQFTVVSEPLEDSQNTDCDDVGYAFVDLTQILRENKDIIDQDIEISDAKDEATLIGFLNITVEALGALSIIQKELQYSFVK